ncbi:MAG TPA: NAD+ synthase [Ktedonobacterales bacterium]|nr:NAD+ synthase [Ktedonobacterales bacterium]
MERADAAVALQIRDFIRATLSAAGMTSVVVNVSGGVDSALSATLALQAVGPENLFLATMPYGEMGTQGINNATLIIESLQVPQDHIFRIDIKRPVDVIVDQTVAPDRVRVGNIMARVRMIYLFDLAKRLGALVCGTENRTEHYLGYFTRFGDAASDLEPISNLYKTQVWELARALNVPEAIIQQAPTAGLWEAQTDEGELGFSYRDADMVLSYHFDEHLTPDDIVAEGIPRETVASVLAHVTRNEFKHHLPYVFTTTE